MGYYDVYDSNDNLIASDVWIDEDNGGGGRPIVVNWYKAALIAMLVIGVCTTFITPVMLFLNRDAFVENGWLHLLLPNLIMGIPILIAAVMMLVTMKKDTAGDPVMDAAERLYSEKFGSTASRSNTDTDDVSDAEYVVNTESANRREAFVAMIYLTVKFGKILRILSMLSFLIYPIAILSYAFEIIFGATESYMIFTFETNILAFVLGGCSVYKNFLAYRKNNEKTVLGRMVRAGLVSLFLGTAVNVIVYALTGIGGYSILVLSLAFMDAIMMIDAKFGSGKEVKAKLHIIAVIAVIVGVGLITLTVACVISLLPGPIYDAILAFDEGVSTDLSLPITVWSICGGVGMIVATVLSVAVNKFLNRNK